MERFYSLPVIESSNSYAKSLSKLPSAGIYVVQADKQSAGRGRGTNQFVSDNDCGLWVSIVQPVQSIADHFIYNRAISLAIFTILKTINPDAPIKIKWPNDIYWGEKKIAGILLENIPGNSTHIIIGFGLNVNQNGDNFSLPLSRIATSIFLETRERRSRSALLKAIIEKYHLYSNESLNSVENVHSLYSENLYRLHERAYIGDINGIYVGVNSDGVLLLGTQNGITAIHSGTLRFFNDELNNERS